MMPPPMTMIWACAGSAIRNPSPRISTCSPRRRTVPRHTRQSEGRLLKTLPEQKDSLRIDGLRNSRRPPKRLCSCHHLSPCPRLGAPINGQAEWWPSGRRHTPAKGADGNVSRVRIPSTPPLERCKPEMRSLTGPFFFLFQRGLARPSDFRRLAFRPKSVSEAPASLSIRP